MNTRKEQLNNSEKISRNISLFNRSHDSKLIEKPLDHNQNNSFLCSLPSEGFMKKLTNNLSSNYKTQFHSPNKSLTFGNLFSKAKGLKELDPQSAAVANRNSWKTLIKSRYDLLRNCIQKVSFIKKEENQKSSAAMARERRRYVRNKIYTISKECDQLRRSGKEEINTLLINQFKNTMAKKCFEDTLDIMERMDFAKTDTFNSIYQFFARDRDESILNEISVVRDYASGKLDPSSIVAKIERTTRKRKFHNSLQR